MMNTSSDWWEFNLNVLTRISHEEFLIVFIEQEFFHENSGVDYLPSILTDNFLNSVFMALLSNVSKSGT